MRGGLVGSPGICEARWEAERCASCCEYIHVCGGCFSADVPLGALGRTQPYSAPMGICMGQGDHIDVEGVVRTVPYSAVLRAPERSMSCPSWPWCMWPSQNLPNNYQLQWPPNIAQVADAVVAAAIADAPNIASAADRSEPLLQQQQ